MTKEEAKQWIRNQIVYSLKIQSNYTHYYHLCYNKQYLRALKLSKITEQPVNKEKFKGGEYLFEINPKTKKFYYYAEIFNHLKENYSINDNAQRELIKEVLEEYEEYKGYKGYKAY